jgi:hypothetical protein
MKDKAKKPKKAAVVKSKEVPPAKPTQSPGTRGGRRRFD